MDTFHFKLCDEQRCWDPNTGEPYTEPPRYFEIEAFDSLTAAAILRHETGLQVFCGDIKVGPMPTFSNWEYDYYPTYVPYRATLERDLKEVK